MTVTIEFEKPAEFINMNDRLHWAVKSKRTKAWRECAGWAAVAQNCKGHVRKCIVGINLPVRSENIRRDGANWHPTLKAVIDGLVDVGVFIDDDGRHVATEEPTFHQGGNTVYVTITEVQS